MTDWSTLKKLIWLRIIKGGGNALRTVSGAIVHITDALALPAKALTVNVEPIQDLHGYDSPWPAGGGVNLLPESVVADATVNGIRFQSFGDGTIKVSGTAEAGANLQINLANPVTLPASDIYVHLLNPVANANVSLFFFNGSTNVGGITLGTVNRIYKLAQLSGATFSALRLAVGNGETVDITFSPMLCLDGTVKPFSSYSNICPISGRTSATVTRTGRNMLNPNDCVDDLYSAVNNMTFQRISGASVYYAFVKPNTTYSLSADKGDRTVVCSCDAIPANNGAIKRVIVNKGTFALPVTFTTAADETIIGIYVNRTAEAKPTQIQLELGSTASAYEPYQGNTYTIQLGDTVYGGTLDVTGGKMTARWGIVDLGTLNWLKSSLNFFYTTLYGRKPGSTNLICTNYKTKPRSLWDADELAISGNVNTEQLYIRDMSLQGETGNEFKADMSGVQLCYELATPLEITLTPTQIDMLLGENNLWADAGDLTLTYYADGNASTSEALGILLGGTYNNPGGADDVSDDEALGILLGGS